MGGNQRQTQRYVSTRSRRLRSLHTTGALLWERRELTFGEEHLNDTSVTGTERFFTGQIEDADAGLYFYNARYLETGIGRFISPDSIVPNPSDPRDHNRYTYVRNNPLKYTDPSGHCIFNIPCSEAINGTIQLFRNLVVSSVNGDILKSKNQRQIEAQLAAIPAADYSTPDSGTISIGAEASAGTTFGVGAPIGGSLYLGVSHEWGTNDWAVSASVAGGPTVGNFVSVGIEITGTDADSVASLAGDSSVVGGSFNPYASFTFGVEKVGGNDYSGGGINLGLGLGSPEVHTWVERTWNLWSYEEENG